MHDVCVTRLGPWQCFNIFDIKLIIEYNELRGPEMVP